MGRAFLHLLLALIAAAAVAVPAWLVFVQPLPVVPGPTPNWRQLARLQRLAEHSCRCARTFTNSDGKADCWRPFESEAAHFAEAARPIGYDDVVEVIDEHSYCDDVSPARRCFGNRGSCVTRSYNLYVNGLGPDPFCTADEASIVHNIWYGQDPRFRTGSAVEAEIRSMARRFAAGDRARPVTPVAGCFGS